MESFEVRHRAGELLRARCTEEELKRMQASVNLKECPKHGPFTLTVEHPIRMHEDFCESNRIHNGMEVLEVIDLRDGWARVAYLHPGT